MVAAPVSSSSLLTVDRQVQEDGEDRRTVDNMSDWWW